MVRIAKWASVPMPRVEMLCRASGQRAVTANRLLDDKRKNILVALLQSTPAVAEIQEPVNNDEAAGRGSELIEILGKAGWSFRRIKWIIPEGEAPTGIVIRSGANNLAMAAQLEKALSDVGVPARQEEQTGSSDWIEVYVAQAMSNRNQRDFVSIDAPNGQKRTEERSLLFQTEAGQPGRRHNRLMPTSNVG
jgi:hypothetical protein